MNARREHYLAEARAEWANLQVMGVLPGRRVTLRVLNRLATAAQVDDAERARVARLIGAVA